MSGYAYLIQPIELVGTEVYKLGTTPLDLSDAMNIHPCGTRYYAWCGLTNRSFGQIESEFKASFEQPNDLGPEYYTGNVKDMQRIIQRK